MQELMILFFPRQESYIIDIFSPGSGEKEKTILYHNIATSLEELKKILHKISSETVLYRYNVVLVGNLSTDLTEFYHYQRLIEPFNAVEEYPLIEKKLEELKKSYNLQRKKILDLLANLKRHFNIQNLKDTFLEMTDIIWTLMPEQKDVFTKEIVTDDEWDPRFLVMTIELYRIIFCRLQNVSFQNSGTPKEFFTDELARILIDYHPNIKELYNNEM